MVLHRVFMTLLVALYCLNPSVSWQSGRIVAAITPAFADSVNYYYDQLGRVIEAANATSGQAAVYRYDAAGNIASINTVALSTLSIAGFSPVKGTVGTQVAIAGTGFNPTASANTVKFNGTTATVSSAATTQLVVNVPAGATTGPIFISNSAGSVTSADSFNVLAGTNAPTITGFSPTKGSAGTSVTISGTNFQTQADDAVYFNSALATITAASATSLTATVPTGTSSGRISVATPYGTAVSANDFFIPAVGFDISQIGPTGRIASDGVTHTLNVTNGSLNTLQLFDGTAGQYLTLAITGNTLPSMLVIVLDPNGAVVSWDYLSGSAPTVELPRLPLTGTYTVLIDPQGGTGSFVLKLLQPVTGTLTIGGAPLQLTLSPAGRRGVISFNGSIGSTVTLNISGDNCFACGVSIFDPQGGLLVSTTTGSYLDGWVAGEQLTLTPALPVDGTYTILIDPLGEQAGTMTLSLTNGTPSFSTTNGYSISLDDQSPVGLSFEGNEGQSLALVATLGAGSNISGASLTVSSPSGETLLVGNFVPPSSVITLPILPVSGLYTVAVQNSGTGTGTLSLALFDLTNPIGLSTAPNPAAVGQAVAMTSLVTGNAPTGLVIFKDGSTSLATTSLVNGLAYFSTARLAQGSHNITAIYGGDANNASGVSPIVTQIIGSVWGTTTKITSSANSVAQGSAVTFTATVSGSSPTGSVTFYDGVTSLGTGPVSNGQSTLTKSSLTAGVHRITAVYSGDGGNAPSTSPIFYQYVKRVTAIAWISGQAPPSSIPIGGDVGIQVQLTGIAPTGTVKFLDGNILVSQVALVNDGGTRSMAAASFSMQVSGARTIYATYSGDESNAPAVLSAPIQVGGAAISVSPGSLHFDNQAVDTTSGTQGITVTNIGTDPLTISNSVINNGGQTGYHIFTNGCFSSLAAGQSCSMSVTFTPSGSSSVNHYEDTLTITSNATNSANVVRLYGTTSGVAGVSPATGMFPDTLISGPASPVQTFTVSNSGTSPLWVHDLAITGTNTGDFRIYPANQCSSTVAPGGSCSIDVYFLPATTGIRSAVLQIPTVASNGTLSVPLSGTGTTSATIDVSPTSLTYSSQLVGTASASQLVTLAHSGSYYVRPATPAIVGANPDDYSIASNSCQGYLLATGNGCGIRVAFTPTAAGNRNATLQILSDAANGTQSVALAGIGIAPVVLVTPTSLTYTAQPINSNSATKTVTVKNNGTSPLHVGMLSLFGTNASDNSNDFSIASNGCVAAVAAGQSCSITAVFAPTLGGSRSSTLLIPSDASNGPQSVSLTGTATVATASVAPAALTFASQLINVASAAQTVTVTNSGQATLTISGAALSGANSGDYVISGNTCSTVSAGANCTIAVKFTPTATGSRSGALQINSNASNGTQTVTLSGTGVAPSASVTPAALAFGNQRQAAASTPKIVTVTNNGTATLHVGSPTLSGANSGDFAVSNNACTAAVAAGANCTISLTFTPGAMGSRVGSLQVASDATNGAQAVSLTGTGVAPVLSVSPASLTYSSQIVGSMSAAQLITVSNTGTSPLTVGTPSFTGTNASDYAISSNGCSAAVNPGSNCTVGVTFAPGAAGSRAATLQIPSDASNGTQAVSLTGTGVAPIASAAPATLTYANQLVNTTSSAQVVTVTNTGTSPLHVGTPTLAGTNPGDFSILSNGCTAVIAVNANCTISVRFRPIAMGSRIGTLQIPSDASNGTQSVSLSGTGIAAVASLAPGSLLYGNQLLNTVSTTQTVTVTNTGTAPLTVSTLTFAGTNPGDFAISSNGCSSAVAAGGNCTIGLTFTPTAVGARSGTLLIASNANNGTRALSLSGTGVAPSASVSPASWAFGNQLLGGTSLATTVTVTNSGTAPLHVGALTLSGANASDFVVSSNGCTSQVAPGANCTISLTFTPSAMGSQVVTLQVSSDASNGAQAVSLTGTGVAPVVSVSPASLTYGSQMVGSMSAAQLITVSNTGTAPLTVGTPTLAGTNPGDFAISSNGCTAAIAANASCTISVTFQPAAMGSRAGTLQIPSDASNGTRSVSLSGTGIAAVASVAPASLSYGNLLLNTTSAAQTVTVTNTGTALLTVSTVTLAGTNPSDFRVSGNGCTAAIAANASCTISVTFKPTAVGGRSGTLQIASNADNGVQSISLSGTGTAPLISVSLTRLAFGDQLLASASPAATVTVTNSGTATLNVGAVSLSGANASDFAVSANGCSSPVAVAANCTISLTFTPGATGSRVGTLLIASDARNGSQTVSLTGNGIAPMAAASPGTLTFANQLVNTPSATQNVVVTNTGTALLHMGTAAISGANAGDFAIISNGCSGSVAVGANCTMSVRFSPSGTGSRAGTLQIVSDATNGTQTISLSGTGIAPAASVAPASLTYSSQLVGSSSAAQTITISNTGTAALHVGTVAVSGSNSGDFAVANNACGSAVAVGQSCTVTLTFSPTAMGSRSATATISSDAINGAQSVSLSGTGIAPLASVTPSSRDFGSVVVLLSSNPMNYTVTNTGTSALNVGTPSFTGANPSEFVISSNGCTSAVAPTGTCSIGVTFKPAHGGSRTAVLQVPSDANNGTQTANATGTGLGL
jgi:hypothetical protein